MKTEGAGDFPAPPVVTFAEATNFGASELGAKAANLVRLSAAGFPVPPGFVVTTAAEGRLREVSARILEAAAGLSGERFAVRSSGTAEDLEDASFAGQYETLLNVPLEELSEAVGRVFDSASASRVSAYRETRAEAAGETSRSRMAVLVQAMVEADSAGVAFTANPVTGERGEVVVTAVRGLGERLVSGEAVGDEWVVRGDDADRRRNSEGAITAEQATEIAKLARRVEAHFGTPQDIEWAISGGRLYLLQARPMTALPEPVEWKPPRPGYWMRNFRLGEWLPEAMTPLFADLLLGLIEEGYLRGMRATVGAAVPFGYAQINGWHYATLPEVSSRLLARALVQSRGRMIPVLWNALIRVNRDPVGADRAVLRRLADEWRTGILPRYRRLVEAARQRVESATPGELSLAGETLVAQGVVDTEEDVFFLTRTELGGREDLSGAVAERRRAWERQRRLFAPLALGTPPKAIRNLMHGAAETARTRPVPPRRDPRGRARQPRTRHRIGPYRARPRGL